MKLGDGKLPPFIGYLPPAVDGVLLELVNMSHKDYPPRRGRTGAQLAEARRLAIDSLHLHFRERRHERALDLMANAMRRVQPFSLYLRNFGLGARVYPARDDPFGLPQVATMASTLYDQEMQRRIATVLAPRIPALCISNPAEAFGVLPAFVVGDDEWGPLARTLVRNAGLIVIYFLSLTSGVEEELDLLRSEGKQDVTLIVREREWSGQPGVEDALLGVTRTEPPIVPAPLEDFPHQLDRRAESGWADVDAKLAEMAQLPARPPQEARIGLPLENMPPEPLRRFCTDTAVEESDAARKLIEQGQYEDAEDVLTRAIAFAYWGRDTLGVAMTLAALGQLNIVGFKAKGEGGFYFERALELCDQLRDRSPTAAALHEQLAEALRVLREEAEAKRAKAERDALRPPSPS